MQQMKRNNIHENTTTSSLPNPPVPETAESLAGHYCERMQRGEVVNLDEYLNRRSLERESAAVEFLSLVNTYRLLVVHEMLGVEEESLAKRLTLSESHD
jgi:hypothetical protein